MVPGMRSVRVRRQRPDRIDVLALLEELISIAWDERATHEIPASGLDASARDRVLRAAADALEAETNGAVAVGRNAVRPSDLVAALLADEIHFVLSTRRQAAPELVAERFAIFGFGALQAEDVSRALEAEEASARDNGKRPGRIADGVLRRLLPALGGLSHTRLRELRSALDRDPELQQNASEHMERATYEGLDHVVERFVTLLAIPRPLERIEDLFGTLSGEGPRVQELRRHAKRVRRIADAFRRSVDALDELARMIERRIDEARAANTRSHD
jgi:hypothetical protein